MDVGIEKIQFPFTLEAHPISMTIDFHFYIALPQFQFNPTFSHVLGLSLATAFPLQRVGLKVRTTYFVRLVGIEL